MSGNIFELSVMTTSSLSQYPYGSFCLFDTSFSNPIHQQLQQTADKNKCGLADVLMFLRTLDSETLQATLKASSLLSRTTNDDDIEWLPIPYALPGSDDGRSFLCKASLFQNRFVIDNLVAMHDYDENNDSSTYVNIERWPPATFQHTYMKTSKIICKISKKILIAILLAIVVLIVAVTVIGIEIISANNNQHQSSSHNHHHDDDTTKQMSIDGSTTSYIPNFSVSMPPYLNLTIIDWRKLTTYYTQRQYSISVIVLHDGTGCTAQATLDALNDVQLSMHYIVDRNGTIYYLVDESNRAWHAGAGSWKTFNNINDVSIGIEVVGVGDEPFPFDQMQSLSSLCRRIIERYAIKAANIIGAYDSAPTRKTDPSGYFDWKLFNSLVGIYPHLFDSSQLDADQQREVLLESMPQFDARVRILQQQLNRVGYAFTNIDGVFMQYTQSIVQAFNRHFCREVFVIEQVIANRTILDERNQRWYRISQERLNNLLADMSSR